MSSQSHQLTITTLPHAFTEGDRIKLDHEPNCIRRYISQIINSTSVQSDAFVRPSRGFRRHNRRVKQSR